MQLRKAAALMLAVSMASFAGIAQATLITHTDGFGVIWTLSNDGVNYGSSSDPIYKVTVDADTTGFATSKGGNDYDYTNSYINVLSILTLLAPTSGSVTGPGGSWTSVIGGQNSNGCDGSGDHFDCAYFNSGGNPVAGPGVLLNTNAGSLEWVFSLGFAAGTAFDEALGFADDAHLKVDYYGYHAVKSCTGTGRTRVCVDVPEYYFLNQVSDDLTINVACVGDCEPPPVCTTDCDPPPVCTDCPAIPEPETVALMGLGLLGMGAVRVARRRSARP